MARLVTKRGASTRLNQLPKEDGNFIVTIDDGRIYTDAYVDGVLKRIPLGGDSGGGGGTLDFESLSQALTTGTLTGISIIPNSESENFDIAVTVDIEINDDGYWVINDIVTSWSARGENGITPSIDNLTKHWMIGETDTGIIAEGQNGLTPSIDSTTKHWIIAGQDTGVIAEGVNGITPSIDNNTKHWMIGTTDTGIIAEGQAGFSPEISVTETSSLISLNITTSTGEQTVNINKTISDVNIISGRVNTSADLDDIASPQEGMVYLVGDTSSNVFDKYIYIDRDGITRWEILGSTSSGQGDIIDDPTLEEIQASLTEIWS